MKKMTRDEALIKLLRENVEKDAKIKDLEKNKKDFDKRLSLLEKEVKRLSQQSVSENKTARVLKEKVTTVEHELNGVKRYIKK
jgi:peptidoglycan hydrolase CwlO-like protein